MYIRYLVPPKQPHAIRKLDSPTLNLVLVRYRDNMTVMSKGVTVLELKDFIPGNPFEFYFMRSDAHWVCFVEQNNGYNI